MVLIGAAAGAGIAIGLLAIVLGLRGTPVAEGRSRPQRDLVARDRIVHASVAAAVGVAVLVMTGWPVAAVLLAALAWSAPGTLRATQSRATDVERIEAVASWTEMLRDTLAAAAGLEEAVLATAESAPEPIRPEVTRLAARLHHESLVAALRRFAEEVANPAADLVVVALVTAARREGRDLVPLLDTLAWSARTEADMRTRVHVSRARIRTSVRVVAGTLALFAGGLVLFNRTYLEPYGTATGQLVLLAVGLFFIVGWRLLQRMARIDGPGRLFTAAAERETER